MKKISKVQRFLVPLFTFIWWRRLHEPHPYASDWSWVRRSNVVKVKGWRTAGWSWVRRSNVVKVKGWRTAIVDGYGGRRVTITFLFGRHRR